MTYIIFLVLVARIRLDQHFFSLISVDLGCHGNRVDCLLVQMLAAEVKSSISVLYKINEDLIYDLLEP